MCKHQSFPHNLRHEVGKLHRVERRQAGTSNVQSVVFLLAPAIMRDFMTVMVLPRQERQVEAKSIPD